MPLLQFGGSAECHHFCKGGPSWLVPPPLPTGWFPPMSWGCTQSILLRRLSLPLSTPVFLEIVDEKSRHSLHENMNKIKAPTQVIWGKQDQVCGHLLASSFWVLPGLT